MTGLCYAEYKAANLLWLLRTEISDFYDLQILCRVFTCKCKCCVFLLQLNAIQGLSYLGSLLSKLESTGMAFSTFLYRCRFFVALEIFVVKKQQ